MADKALLLGVNEYESISDLRGCVNDVQNLSKLLSDSYGFDDVRTLLNEEVTKENVTEGFRWLVDGVHDGDRIVLHFSGHGSYRVGDDEDEPIDELVCLHGMNWEDPDSYLLDDELGEFTKTIPDGATLTVVLDCCHSGTGTRTVGRASPKNPQLIIVDTAVMLSEAKEFVSIKQKIEQGNREVLQRLREDDRQVVLGRFVERPKYRGMRSGRSIRRFGESLRVEINHQLLSACTDVQTAADAYIHGDYNGAFTYYLCRAARENGAGATVSDLMNRVQELVQAGGYSQTPQSEGPFRQCPLFTPHLAGTPALPMEPSTPATDAPLPSLVAGSALRLDSRELVAQMFRVYEKLVEFADRLLSQHQTPSAQPGGGQRVVQETIVYIHGIRAHQAGFSNPWWEALRPHLHRSLDRREVIWSDIVNRRDLAPKALGQQAELTRRQIDSILQDRVRQEGELSASGSPPSAEQTVRGLGFSIDDFLRYMFNQNEREQILARFDAVVRPLLQDGATVQIISHSWGTVVAWESLRRLDASPLPGRVANLFLVASPLSIGPVQSNLYSRIGDGRLPAKVMRAINLDAQGDIVGGRIGDHFSVHDEFLDLEPTGCGSFLGLINPDCAHSSYFRAANTRVNRDILAHLIN